MTKRRLATPSAFTEDASYSLSSERPNATPIQPPNPPDMPPPEEPTDIRGYGKTQIDHQNDLAALRPYLFEAKKAILDRNRQITDATVPGAL